MNDTILKALNWRYAVKEFDATKKVSDQDLTTILESARLAPSSNGIEAWKFIVVENPEVRKQLRAVGYDQSKITEASHLIVLAYRTDMRENIVRERLERTAQAQNKSIEDLAGLQQMLEGGISYKSDDALLAWSQSQTYIALGMMIETASLLGVDNGPMEGFDSKKVDEILGLAEHNLASTSMLALGYRSQDDAFAKLPKVRREFDDAIMFVK